MLERPDLVRSPIALAKLVELLQAMLATQLDPRRRALGGARPAPHPARGRRCAPGVAPCPAPAG
jgi:hypothetical protein